MAHRPSSHSPLSRNNCSIAPITSAQCGHSSDRLACATERAFGRTGAVTTTHACRKPACQLSLTAVRGTGNPRLSVVPGAGRGFTVPRTLSLEMQVSAPSSENLHRQGRLLLAQPLMVPVVAASCGQCAMLYAAFHNARLVEPPVTVCPLPLPTRGLRVWRLPTARLPASRLPGCVAPRSLEQSTLPSPAATQHRPDGFRLKPRCDLQQPAYFILVPVLAPQPAEPAACERASHTRDCDSAQTAPGGQWAPPEAAVLQKAAQARAARLPLRDPDVELATALVSAPGALAALAALRRAASTAYAHLPSALPRLFVFLHAD